MSANDKPTRMLAMMGEGGVIISLDDSPELPDNIEDGVDSDGIVEGHAVETYYHPFLKLIEGDGYLRVVADGDFTDIETRIPHSMLNAAGWHKQ